MSDRTPMDEKCVMDGQHAQKGMRPVMFNADDGPGPMCERHKNIWLRENGKEKKKIERDYTHPDKRTYAWKEDQAHKYQRERHRILSGRVSKP